MTLRELINAVLDKGHLSFVTQFVHKEYYSDQPKSERHAIHASYQGVLGELLELGFKKPEYEIYVHEKEDEGEKFTDVSLYCEEDEEAYAMDLTSWVDLIDAKIKNDLKLSNNELLGHILWEMTFYGFTQERSEELRDEIKRIATDMGELSKDKMEYLIDEVKKTFGDDVEEAQ